MSSKYKIAPTPNSPSHKKLNSTTPPRKRPSINHANNNTGKQSTTHANEEEATELLNYDGENSTDSRPSSVREGRARSGSMNNPNSRQSPTVRGRKSISDDSSITFDNNHGSNNNSNNFINNYNNDSDSVTMSKIRRSSKNSSLDAPINQSPASQFIRPSLSRGGSTGNLQNRSRRGSFDDDNMSVSSVTSKAKPKPALRSNNSTTQPRRNSGNTASNSTTGRKKKVQFRMPLADYHEHNGEYFEFEDDEYSGGKSNNISFIPKRLRRKREEDFGCQCCVFM